MQARHVVVGVITFLITIYTWPIVRPYVVSFFSGREVETTTPWDQ